MKILVINTGSSSLKYKLFDMNGNRAMTGGIVERIGEKESGISHMVFSKDGKETVYIKKKIVDQNQGMHEVVSFITDVKTGVIDAIKEIDAIGHRVVQGGEKLKTAILINDEVKKTIRDNNKLAPLHNPSNLTGIEVAERIFPGKPNIAVFDTNFHQTMPDKAFLYGLPYELYEKYKIRKYGFHGTSHKYVVKEASRLMGKATDRINLITLHLGNGCSACAVKKGECVDTSMGMTPLAGMMMGTRSGDIDPAIVGYLLENTDMDIRQLNRMMNKESGLKGICGLNDMRDIHAQAQKGNEKATLALEMFSYHIKKQIGAYFAVLGTVDAIVFTAGIGENDHIIRSKVCDNLSSFGVEVDLKKNKVSSSNPYLIHSESSRVQVWVIQTDEELQIAREAVQVLGKD
ncbi:MAG: acetate kinase [Desulfobacula sp.]|uniref:acetate/propionate family kinase n=1 Tax=Desulfobacula sp. TaxID=2593537 RepID=UPI0025C0183F|nr:acetate kinase [Desulfobacula sp.]MCD4722551.1 acetate kinase [Desulfobacula sp.]